MRTTKVSKSAALILAFRAFDAGAFSARPTDHHRTAPSVQASSHAPPPPPQTPASSSSTDATRDPHAVLGLDRTSPPGDFAEVQRAYRHLARRYHPDVSVGPDATPREREMANADFARIRGGGGAASGQEGDVQDVGEDTAGQSQQGEHR